MLQIWWFALAAALAGDAYVDAQVALRQGRPEAALELLAGIPVRESDRAPLQNLKALVFSELHRYREAIEAIQRARQLDGKNEAYAYNAGLILFDARQYAGAEKVLLDAIQMFGPTVPLLSALGETQLRLNRFTEAEHTLDEAVAADPNSLAAWIVLAKLHRMTGATDRFAGAAGKAHTLAPENYEASFYYGLAQMQEGRRNRGIGYVRASIEQRPDFAEGLKTMGRILSDDGKWAEAVEYYERAAAADTADAETMYLLSKALRKLGQTEKANAALSRYRALSR